MWKQFCSARGIHDRVASVGPVLEFLADLHSKGHRYSSLNTARAALSALLSLNVKDKVGQHELVKRFMKGVFEQDPVVPRYQCIWKVKDVTDYLRSKAPARSLSLKDLSLKLVMLLALVTGQRIQTLQALDLNCIHKVKSEWVFTFDVNLKHMRQNKTAFSVSLRPYPADRRLCVLTYLNEYVRRTEKLRKTESRLLVSFVKPHKKVSRDTIARWLCCVLQRAGVDTSQYRAHSTRAASTSHAASRGVPTDEIMRMAGWSSADTFQKYYKKPIIRKPYAETVLS